MTAPHPWKATLCLTYLCNLRCGFCRIWERRPEGEMTAGEWRRVLERSPRFAWIDLTGGEITLREDWEEIAEAAVAIHRPRVLHFPTNGSFPARLAPLEALARKTRLVVTVSIDGPREIHDRMRGVEGSWEKTVESLARIRAMKGVKVKAGMTLCRENEDEVERAVAEIAARVAGFGPEDLHVNLAQVSSHYYGNEAGLFEEARKVPKGARSEASLAGVLAGWLENRYRRLLPRYLATRRCPLPCRSLAATVFVSPTGEVHPCITDPRVVGHLRESNHDLAAILESPEAERLRKAIGAGDCPHCWTPCEAYPTIVECSLPARWVLNIARLL